MDDNIIVKEVSDDSFTLRVKIEKIDKTRIKIHTELIYLGEKSINIIHSDPLVGVVVGDGVTKPDIVYSFVGIPKTLVKNEVYSYEKDRIIDIRSTDKVVYTQVFFTSNDEKKIINLDIKLDKFK
jgi:hypothetical protein